MEVNGKEYPMWGQLVERKEDFIGGVLEDFGDSFDRSIGTIPMITKITNIILRPNGEDSAFFEVCGEDFTCGFDVQYGGLADGDNDWLTFIGYGGHEWRITKSND